MRPASFLRLSFASLSFLQAKMREAEAAKQAMPVANDKKPGAGPRVEEVADQVESVALNGNNEHDESDEIHGDDDSSLFADPPPREECPVCLATLPLEEPMTIYMSCCDNTVCKSCIYQHERVNQAANTTPTCPFCRAKKPDNEEGTRRIEAAAKKGTATAFYFLANDYRLGLGGVPVDERRALELYRRAADLGHAQSCGIVGNACVHGDLGACIDKEEGFNARPNTKVYMYGAMGHTCGKVCEWHLLSIRLESHAIESGTSLVGGQSRTRVSRRETNWLTTNASGNHTGLDWLKPNAARRASGKGMGGYKNSLNGPT